MGAHGFLGLPYKVHTDRQFYSVQQTAGNKDLSRGPGLTVDAIYRRFSFHTCTISTFHFFYFF